MALYRKSQLLNINDRNYLYTDISVHDSPTITKGRIFFFPTMAAATSADIRLGTDNGGLAPNLTYTPSSIYRSDSLRKAGLAINAESFKDRAKLRFVMGDVSTTMTQEDMVFAINQEYSEAKDASNNTIGWLPPSPIQTILPPAFPVAEVQRPFLSITAIAPGNPDPTNIKAGAIPLTGVDSGGGATYYFPYADHGGHPHGILHYTVPTYSRASYIHNHDETRNLLVSFHPKYPFFIVEPDDAIYVAGGMDMDVVAVSEDHTPIQFSVGFGLSKT